MTVPVLSGAGATLFYRMSLRDKPAGDQATPRKAPPAPALVGYEPSRGLHLGAPMVQFHIEPDGGERRGVVSLLGGRF
ncbi:MAG: hypothetical protein AAFS10_27800 [Myxococcota bacterium]